MLDSLLTVTKGSVFWMLGAVLLLVVMDRAIAVSTGLPITFFLVIAVGVVASLVVAGGYTIVKTLRH